MLPLLSGGASIIGSVLGTGLKLGTGVASTALKIGGKVAGLGAKAVGGGVRAVGGALGFGKKEDTAQQVTPKQGDTVTTSQPNKVKQQQQKAEKQQNTATSKLTKQAQDTSRKSEKVSKNANGILAAVKMQLEKLNDKVGGIIRIIVSREKRDSRKALESKVESERAGDKEAAAVPKQSIAERGKSMLKKTGGFISSVLGLLLKYFLVKIGTLALFPELAGQFKEFETNIVGFFKNGFDALKKLFTGDLEGAKESGKAAFDNLLGVLKGVAKFASGLVDKVLKFFGMKELNLFDKANKKIEGIKEGLDKDLGEEGDGKSFLEKIFRKLEIMLVDMFAVLKEFLSPGNLFAMYRKAGKLEDIAEDEKKELARIDNLTNPQFARQDATKQEFKAGNISTSYNTLKRRVEDGKATATEQDAFARINAAVEAQKEKMRDEVRSKFDKQREDAEIPFFKKENVEAREAAKKERVQQRLERDAEKKLKQKATGAEIGESSARQQNSVNVVNAPTSVNKGGDQIVSTTNVSGGGAKGGTTNQELSQHYIQTTYASV